MEATREQHREAMETVRAWWDAWIRGDSSAVAGLSHPYFDELGDQHRFRHLDSMQLTDEVVSCPGQCHVERWSIIAESVICWRGVLVCHYRFEIRGNRGSRRFEACGSATDVLVRSGASLKVFSHQGEIGERVGPAVTARKTPTQPKRPSLGASADAQSMAAPRSDPDDADETRGPNQTEAVIGECDPLATLFRRQRSWRRIERRQWEHPARR